MVAESREAVFAALREKGIKAIKVIAEDGSKANGETRFITRKRFVFAALAAGLAVGVCLAIFAPRLKEDFSQIGRYQPGMKDKIAALRSSADALLSDHEKRMDASGVKMLTDYAEVFANTNAAVFSKTIQEGYRELNVSRQKMRELFRSLYDIFPPECVNERTDAQRLYGDAMDSLDRSEAQLARNEKAYQLLISNRGKWIAKDGIVVFADDNLAKEFTYFQRGLDPAETRWSRDFEK